MLIYCVKCREKVEVTATTSEPMKIGEGKKGKGPRTLVGGVCPHCGSKVRQIGSSAPPPPL